MLSYDPPPATSRIWLIAGLNGEMNSVRPLVRREINMFFFTLVGSLKKRRKNTTIDMFFYTPSNVQRDRRSLLSRFVLDGFGWMLRLRQNAPRDKLKTTLIQRALSGQKRALWQSTTMVKSEQQQARFIALSLNQTEIKRLPHSNFLPLSLDWATTSLLSTNARKSIRGTVRRNPKKVVLLPG